MKAALYIRVSTQEQVENYSIESQKEKLEAYCKAKGWIVYDFYIDPGYSGSNMERPSLQRLLNDIHNIDVIIVYKLDRLSRSQRDTLTLIEDHILKNNVEFVSITETLDTSTPFGKAMIGILSVFAQLERETIAERMRMGHIKRAEEGYRGMGGDYDPAGYGRKDGELILKEDEAKHIQLAYDFYEQLRSITKVQKKLKELGYSVWRFRRYNDILRNKLYCGYVSFAGEHYKGRHQMIISEEQFERVQILLSRHKGNNAHKAKESLLSGILTCGYCGEKFVTYSTGANGKRNYGRTYRYYLCRARRFPSEYKEKCMNKNWNATKLDKLIAEEIINLITKTRVKEKGKEDKTINFDNLLKKIDDKLNRLVGLYADGSVPIHILNKQVQATEEERDQLLQRKREQADRLRDLIDVKELKEYAVDIIAAEFPVRQAIVQKMIKSITIKEEDLEIIWDL